MKRIFLFSLFAVALAFALPLLLRPPGRGLSEGAAETPPPAETAAPSPALTADAPSPAPAAGPVLDAAVTLDVLTETGVAQMTLADYLPQALAGEMPASFAPEALKAQAVALRTYALHYKAERKAAHPDADVCASPGCCAALADEESLRAAWGGNYEGYASKLAAAVAATDGQYLVWDEAPALTVFHAASAGRTEDGAALGVSAPYLVSVDTPETGEAVRNLISTVEVTASDFAAAVHTLLPEADLTGPPEGWLGAAELDAAGRVRAIAVGGRSLSGLAARQLFSLRSTDFTVTYTEGRFLFRVRGSGHGLGLSQYGADCMADAGADYQEILAHYYPGTALVMAMVE